MGLTVGGNIRWGAGASWIQYQAPAGFQTFGVEINRSGLLGETAYASRNTALVGLSPTAPSQFILSAWINPRTMPSALPRIFELFTSGGGLRFRAALSTTAGLNPGYLLVQFLDSGNRIITLSAPTPIPCGSWTHFVLAAYVPPTLINRVYQCYINNVAQTLSVTDDVNFTAINWASDRTGAFTNGFSPGASGTTYFGNLAEVYFAPGQYLDLSTTSNLRKFITAGGGTPDLGSNGSNPTGTAPTIFFKGPISSFISGVQWVNYGTGGNFSGTGTSFTYNSLSNPPSTP